MHMAPFIPRAIRLQRACLKDIPTELHTRYGLDVIIDFASGFPTQDHLHQCSPPGMTVIYADIDPYVVAEGQALLHNTPNAHFFQSDMRYPEQLLQRPEVQPILAGKRTIGFVTWGVMLFFSDQEIMDFARAIYNWSDQGACWVCGFPLTDYNLSHPAVIQFLNVYKAMNEPLYPRTQADCPRLVQPWHPDERGFVSFTQWHGLDPYQFMTPADLEAVGPTGGGYAAYLIK